MKLSFVDQRFANMTERVPEVVKQFLFLNYDTLGRAVLPVAAAAATLWLGLKVLKVYTGQERADPWSVARALLTVMFVFWALSWGKLAGTVFTAL